MARREAGAIPPGRLEDPLLGLPGVGPRTAERLAARGLSTRADLIALVPRRWDDLRAVTSLGELQPGRLQTTRAAVRSARVVFARRRFLEVVFEDDAGGQMDTLRALWFHFRGGLKDRFTVGARFLLVGVPRPYKGALQMAHPETLRLDDDEGAAGAGIRVRYPEIEGVPGPIVSRLCRLLAAAHADAIPDGLPAPLRVARGFPSQGEALLRLHQVPGDAPPAQVEALNRGEDPAQRRLAYDELFFLQLGLARRRAERQRDAAPPCPTDGAALRRFLGALPFAPTAAQRRAIDEIAADLAAPRPMHRLLQGDVGSGKTVVLFAAAALAMAAGFQVAVMAPTEILAEQHARTLAPWARESGYRMALLTASTPRPAREEVLAALADKRLDLVLGTHALLGERVRFARLGLVVIDEQHRFGVAQRAALRDKGGDAAPHLLVMTATPIPRTLALTVYGDLDVTTLDELPPGRTPVQTELHVGTRGRGRAYSQILRALAEGRQGYVVCPRVEGAADVDADPDGDAGSAVDTYTRLQRMLPGTAIGLVHGRLAAPEREAVMQRFRAGEVRLLVATTVVEVGVDVAQADVMLIEGAERFGLATLHQLRGRVGRGGGRGLCLLLADEGAASDPGAAPAAQRLDVMLRGADGFAIAEADLRLRGPGEIHGTRQAGLPRLRFADLGRDLALLQQARRDAFALLDADPHLERPEHAATAAVLAERWRGGLYLREAG